MTKTQVSDDDLYRHTSQFRLWSFTRDQFHTRQRNVHDAAVARISAQLKELGITPDDNDIRPLSLEEELELIRFYASKVESIAKIYHMPSQVRATAVSYFRKFYLVYSVMDYHPKNILYTCVFLASKAENFFISIEKFCGSLPRTEPAQLLDLEFLILQSLSFTLTVLNGLRPLHGFFLDLQDANPNIPESEIGQLHDRARKIIIQGFVSDAPFLFTPPHIALASLHHVDPDLTENYLRTKYKEMPSEHVSHLIDIVKDCQKELLATDVPASERGKEIDRQLHFCLNPQKYLQKRKLDKSSNSTPEPSESPAPKRQKLDE